MKANHNSCRISSPRCTDVSDTSKILKWKQITTFFFYCFWCIWCFRYFKDTKMKANHNGLNVAQINAIDVSDTSKILKWKQITTRWDNLTLNKGCFRYFKDTKMKANHNIFLMLILHSLDVSDTSKILKWKQITTLNNIFSVTETMFPILQRY